MGYATINHLVAAAAEGWGELAQRAAPDAVVEGELLLAVAEGASTAAWTPEQVAAATDALGRLTDALDRASKHADTHLFPHYRQVMPLSAELVNGSSLPEAVAQIALRRLYGTAADQEMRRNTAWADEYLMALAKGTVSLGAADTQVAQPAGSMAARTPPNAFDWGSY